MLKRIISSAMAAAVICSALPAGFVPANAEEETEYILGLGDVDGDGRIDAVDASIVQKDYAISSVGKGSLFDDPDFPEYNAEAADVNGDGRINAIDASYILVYYAYIMTGARPEEVVLGNPEEFHQTYTVDGGFTNEQIVGSAIKPVVEVSKVVVDEDYAKANPTYEVKVRVCAGMEEYYSSFGLHVYLDPRLKIRQRYLGGISVQAGEGSEWLNGPICEEAEPGEDMNSFFVTMAGYENRGYDGTLFSFDVTLPADVKPGDIFPIDIRYEPGDLFIDHKVTEEGSLMQSYFFNYGINNEKNQAFFVPPEDIEKCPALDYIDRSYDGYIAVEGVAEEDKLWGDANVDGKVDLNDAVAILQYVALPVKYPLKDEGIILGDVDGTPGISGTDALSIQKFDSKLISKLPEK